MSLPEQLEAIHDGTEPALVCQVNSGWVVLGKKQYLRGYCILLPDPLVPSLNALNAIQQTTYLADMALVGDALLEVTGAYRINYAILGNTDPFLHAHIAPRYLSEPDEYRRDTPWSYPKKVMDTTLFDYQRDKSLIGEIRAAIKQCL
jgi:diadenosine tetraphosphate (Ap4A) HIT family hydrolase